MKIEVYCVLDEIVVVPTQSSTLATVVPSDKYERLKLFNGLLEAASCGADGETVKITIETP